MSENDHPAPVRSVSSDSTPTAAAAEGMDPKRPWETMEGSSAKKINLHIAGPDGLIVTYFVPVNIPLQKILKRYCEFKHLEYMGMQFLDHEGRRVHVRRTAEELHMGEGYQIGAFVYSNGA